MKGKKMKISIPLSILKNLRESSGFNIDDIAKKLNTSKEKVEAVEEGKLLFTLTQIKKLADIYKRPIVAFFSDVAPKIPYVLKDYRINREKRLTPEVHLAERRAYYLSSKIAELSGKKSHIPIFSENMKADELAIAFKKKLNIKLIKGKKPEEILSYYKNILEEDLSIVILEYPLKADDVRAFSISSNFSAIVINEQDNAQIKLFSLFHEVCHLLKRNSGICSIEIEKKDYQDIETYCNRFAAEFLVPANDLVKEIKGEHALSFDWNVVLKLAKVYGVSKQVMMIRLLWLNYIKLSQYKDYKDSLEKKEPKKPGFGKRNWNKVFYNRAGSLAINEISKSYKKGDITFFEAINVLNIKSKYVEKFIS